MTVSIMPSTIEIKLFCISILAMALLRSPGLAENISSGKMTIYTVNYPLQYFTERIGGEYVEVVFPAPNNVDPAYWMPGREIIKKYQEADLIVLNGAQYARWVKKVSLPLARIVNTSRQFRDRYIRLDHAVTHSHGAEGAHAHEDLASTIWLDPELAALQATAIEEALSRKMPNHKSTFQKNLVSLKEDLVELDQEIKAITMKGSTKPLLTSHPVYGYLAGRYGLRVKSVQWGPDEMPSVAQLRELSNVLEKHPAQWMIWEGEPMPEQVARLKSMGVDSVIYDLCGNVPARGDFFTVMQKNIENLRIVFKP